MSMSFCFLSPRGQDVSSRFFTFLAILAYCVPLQSRSFVILTVMQFEACFVVALTNNCLQHLFFQKKREHHIFLGKLQSFVISFFNISKIKSSCPLSNIYNIWHFKWEFLTRIKSNEDFRTYLSIVFDFESQSLIRNQEN